MALLIKSIRGRLITYKSCEPLIRIGSFVGTYPFCQIKAKFTFYTVILDFIKNIRGDYISWQSYYLIYHLYIMKSVI